MRLEEIETRMAEIHDEALLEDADLDALDQEVDALKEERAAIMEKAEKRQKLIDEVVRLPEAQVTKTFEPEEERKMEKVLSHETPEYRVAWLNKMRGVPLTEAEERAFTGSQYVVPDSTANKIIDQLVDMVPLLNEVELLHVKGNVSVAVQVAAPAPTKKAGGEALSEATTTLLQVSLGYYTLSTLVRIGADISSMAIDAFEGWLTGKIAEQLAYKIEDYLVNGDGDSDPKGIDYAYVASAWADGTDAVDWAGGSLASTDIDKAIGMLPAAYDRASKFLMSKKTFYTYVIGLTDVNNVPLIEREGHNFILRGYPVMFSDKVATKDIFFGDFKRGMVANLSNEIKIERDRNLSYNSYDFLGWCSFDCKPSGVPCIIKIADDIA